MAGIPYQRRSIRLAGFNYTLPGAYFVTIVTWGREWVLGQIIDEKSQLNEVGQMVTLQWERLPLRFPQLKLDEFVVMPDHIHGILIIAEPDRRRGAGGTFKDANSETDPLRPYSANPPNNVIPGSLGAFARAFKSSTTYRFNRMRSSTGLPLWQRNYYEHIIRTEAELNQIRQYIQNNPLQWALDLENPVSIK